MIAEVVFNLPLDRAFHYLVPSEWHGRIQPGMRVEGPFGAKQRIGFVTKLLEHSDIKQLKPLRRLLDPVPVIA